MVMVKEESSQKQNLTCSSSQKKEHSNRNIHVNGHRRKHTATEIYMRKWSQKKVHSNRNIYVNGHRRNHTATETYMLMVTEEST